ncbi:PLP-dependent transferase [Streptomyces sp. NPDC001292]|uniref:PLP-dependent transferase n=1 Tax=Streptomyces sp. NPDC001292 TaxID=3364558 RepID=UPI0036825482
MIQAGARWTTQRMWSNELTEEELAEANVPGGLIRFAVGLEHEADLIADLSQGLAAPAARVPHDGGCAADAPWRGTGRGRGLGARTT